MVENVRRLNDDNRSPSTTRPYRNSVYYLKDGIIFLAEDQLFKVPRYMLELNSFVFTDMFSLPSSEGEEHGEGFTDDNPIRLPEQVTSIDFQRLLALLYPLTTEYETFMKKWGHDEWMSILNLTTMWGMDGIRTRAIQKLNEVNRFPSPLAQISCGKKYGYPRWIRAGFSTLVTRLESLSESDGLDLGIKDALRCAAAREIYIRRDGLGARTVGKILDEVFGEDIPKDNAAGCPISRVLEEFLNH